MANLFLFPESFDNPYWTKLNFQITPDDIVAPDSTATADKLVCSSPSGGGYIYRGYSVISGNKYTTSVFVKKGNVDYFILNSQIGTAIVVDLNTGVVTDTVAISGTLDNYGVNYYGNGWYRIWNTSTPSSSFSCDFYFTHSNSSQYASRDQPLNSYCYMWGTALSEGIVLEPYVAESSWNSILSKRLLIGDGANRRYVVAEAPALSYVRSIGSAGTGNGQFTWAVDACSDATNIFATDSYNGHRIQKFDMNGNFISTLGNNTIPSDYGFGDQEFGKTPYNVVTDGTRIYVSDRICGLIKAYNSNDFSFSNLVGRWDWTFGQGSGLFCKGLAAYGGMLYALDSNGDGAVLAIDPASSFLIKHGASIFDSGLYGGGIHADANNIYIQSTGFSSLNDRGIYKYNRSTLALVDSVTIDAAGNLGICGDATHIYSLDGTGSSLIKRLKSDLSTVATYPSYGDSRDFNGPIGCAVDGTYVYVCDYANHRIVRVDKSSLSYVSEVEVGAQHGWPQFIALDSTYMYIMSFGATVKVAKYDIATITLQATSSQNFSATGSHWITIDEADPDNSLIYVAGQYGSPCRVLDRSTLTVQYTSGVSGDPPANNNVYEVGCLAITPDGTKLLASYANANSYLYNVKVFNTSDFSFIDEYALGNGNQIPMTCVGNLQFLLYNDVLNRIELRNITTFALINSITTNIANGFPTDTPSILGLAYDAENDKIYATNSNANEIWRLSGSTLAFEVADGVPSYNGPIGIQIYDYTAPPPTNSSNIFGHITW